MLRCRVYWRLTVVAEQSNGIAFEMAAVAVWARSIIYTEPKKGHVADVLGDGLFNWKFGNADVLRSTTADTPALSSTLRIGGGRY